jgi:hypothetical protein
LKDRYWAAATFTLLALVLGAGQNLKYAGLFATGFLAAVILMCSILEILVVVLWIRDIRIRKTATSTSTSTSTAENKRSYTNASDLI